MLITIRSLKERRFAGPRKRRSLVRRSKDRDCVRGGMVQEKNEMRFACAGGLPSVISII